MNDLQQYETPYYNSAEVIKMDEIPEYNIEDYDLFDPKQFKKYIDDIERLVRSSKEYRDYISYLKKHVYDKDVSMNASTFLANVNAYDNPKVKIELHHSPFTLYDIVLTVFNKRSAKKESLDATMVAKEACYAHYLLYVGLVPLSTTEHKLVHNQSLFIPFNKILGHFDRFISAYKEYIPEDAMDRYNVYKDISDHYNEEENLKVLEVSPTYIKLPGSNNNLGSYTREALENVLANTRSTLIEMKSTNTYSDKPRMIKPFTLGNQNNQL